MPPRIPSHPFKSIPQLTRRNLSTTPIHLNTQPQPQPQPSSKQQPSAYKQGMSRYNLFASPFAKVFLGAVFTYQVIYWTWLKLEMEETKAGRNQQVAALEKEVRELTGVKKEEGEKS